MGGVWTPYRGGSDSSVPEAATTFPKDRLLATLEALAKILNETVAAVH